MFFAFLSLLSIHSALTMVTLPRTDSELYEDSQNFTLSDSEVFDGKIQGTERQEHEVCKDSTCSVSRNLNNTYVMFEPADFTTYHEMKIYQWEIFVGSGAKQYLQIKNSNETGTEHHIVRRSAISTILLGGYVFKTHIEQISAINEFKELHARQRNFSIQDGELRTYLNSIQDDINGTSRLTKFLLSELNNTLLFSGFMDCNRRIFPLALVGLDTLKESLKDMASNFTHRGMRLLYKPEDLPSYIKMPLESCGLYEPGKLVLRMLVPMRNDSEPELVWKLTHLPVVKGNSTCKLRLFGITHVANTSTTVKILNVHDSSVCNKDTKLCRLEDNYIDRTSRNNNKCLNLLWNNGGRGDDSELRANCEFECELHDQTSQEVTIQKLDYNRYAIANARNITSFKHGKVVFALDLPAGTFILQLQCDSRYVFDNEFHIRGPAMCTNPRNQTISHSEHIAKFYKMSELMLMGMALPVNEVFGNKTLIQIGNAPLSVTVPNMDEDGDFLWTVYCSLIRTITTWTGWIWGMPAALFYSLLCYVILDILKFILSTSRTSRK